MDPIDIDAIEAEWKGVGDNHSARRLIRAVRELAAKLAAADAEIARLNNAIRDLRDAEVAKILAPPGADVMERAERCMDEYYASLDEYYASLRVGRSGTLRVLHEDVARALQQYGDERATAAVKLGREASGLAARAAGREAREVAIKEVRGIVLKHEMHRGICDKSSYGCVRAILYVLDERYRALAAKPGSKQP